MPKQVLYDMKEKKQLKYDIAYLRIAAEWSKLSYCKRKQVGAIIVRDRMIISDGYNGTPSGFENCCEDEEGLTQWFVLHAEANAISKVARSTQTCENATLYITLSPCIACARIIFTTGIRKVIYLNSYAEYKKIPSDEGVDFLKKFGVDVVQFNTLNLES
jgi:dCMP deaminase